ncbi:MAG TPA: hypothetical protein VM030_08130 [Acidimicrobiales bacterium]|nr:hypothetical protein [Acidimicrobiales bacterium]
MSALALAPVLAHAGATELSSWRPIVILAVLFTASFVFLAVRGDDDRPHALPLRILLRGANGIERLTGVAGWAVGMVAIALFGLLMAGIGFYADVAWHVDLGRDKVLFTAPHTMIVLGLLIIAVSSLLGVTVASITKIDTPLRWKALRVPWSAVPLGLLGFTALAGFPLDDVWHRMYGIDVTMWSPTHLIMICGASLSPIPCWLALAEAGAKPTDGGWARALHVVCGWLMLAGLSSVLGEFEFGVPQFQQLYHPVLIALAAGVALTACRVVLGPVWTLVPVIVTVGERIVQGSMVGTGSVAPDGHVLTRPAALYLGCAVAVELAGLVLGTRNRLRFAIGAGVSIATIGMAAEWWWNANAHQPWTSNLLPAGVVLPAIVAIGAAVIGASFGSAILGAPARLGRPVLGIAFAAVVAGLLLPLPRTTGDVDVDMKLEPVGAEMRVRATLDPPDAADEAKWFQVTAWQGGGMVLADMQRTGPGEYVSSRTVPVTGKWKTMLRLHRGAEMMAVPIFLPADAEIDEAEVPAVDRRGPFVGEQQYLLRESKSGPGWYAVVAYILIAGIAALWIGSIGLAAVRIPSERPPTPARTEERV